MTEPSVSHATLPPEALAGITVLDLTDSIAGQFCGRLFADNGARVTLIEPLDGSQLRRSEPMLVSSGQPDASALFAHLNLGKSSVTIDCASREGISLVRRLARRVDVVVTDGGQLAGQAEAEHWGSVRCRITPFGTTGPWSQWRGDELVFQALASTMNENGIGGREPLYGCGHRASYAAGVIGYIECLSVLFADGTDSSIDVSIAEVAASMSYNRATQYSYNRSTEARDARTTPRATLRCADGWLNLFISGGKWKQTCVGLRALELLEDPRFQSESDRLDHWPELEDELTRRVRDRRVDEVVAEAQRHKAVAARCVSPAELAHDPQLRAREFWTYWSERQSVPRLGPMFRMSGTPQRSHGGPPERGEMVDGSERAFVGKAGNETVRFSGEFRA